jgi:Myb/SANT-like DNA-binding domain
MSSADYTRWTGYETEQLLNEFNAERARAKRDNRKQVVWRRIRRNLRKKGIDRPVKVLKWKFSYMCKTYQKTRKNTSSQAPLKSGKFFQLYNETFEDLYGDQNE